jgi:tRNA pseudouridine55 synthase
MSSLVSGIILIDKPRGMTSHDVVARLRRVAGNRQVGHTGTLDPMADGLLIVCIGPATRVAQFLVGLDKIYVGGITLGAISSTYDAEGTIVAQSRPLPKDADLVRAAMARQVGELIQLPPSYSAIKVRGKKLYEYARDGEPVPQKPRPVKIMHFDLVRYAPPEIHFMAKVGSGTYIRSMAHDLGVALECGAYLSQLRRIQVGAFSVDQAILLETLIAEPSLLPHHLLSIPEALGHMPKITILPLLDKAILNGCPFTTRDILEFDGILSSGQPTLVVNTLGRALAVVQPEPERAKNSADTAEEEPPALGSTPFLFRPLRVLVQPQ